MSYTRAWKIYGVDGHRNKESFNNSYEYDFSENGNAVVIKVYNSDYTGTNEYNIIEITRNTYDECYEELLAQIYDGIYENCRIGNAVEIEDGSEIKEIIAVHDLYEHLNKNIGSIEMDFAHGYLTFNETRDGRDVAWYIDEIKSAAIYVDTREILTEEEIEEGLC